MLPQPTHWMDSFLSRYPAIARWLAPRLTTDRFTGLPLTALSVGLMISVATLSEVAENIVNAEPMVQVDQVVTQWLFQGRSSGLSQLFYGLTWLGSAYVTIGVGLAGSLVLLRLRSHRRMLILWVLLAGIGLFVQLGKRQYTRPRPLQVAYYAETGFSFPSGHSATALVLYGLLGYWWMRRLPDTRGQIGVGLQLPKRAKYQMARPKSTEKV